MSLLLQLLLGCTSTAGGLRVRHFDNWLVFEEVRLCMMSIDREVNEQNVRSAVEKVFL